MVGELLMGRVKVGGRVSGGGEYYVWDRILSGDWVLVYGGEGVVG